MRGAGRVTADDVLGYGAARVVLATGASWVGDGESPLGPDSLPGADAADPRFVTPEQFWAGKDIGERVMVLDGDGYFRGISIAEVLADRGCRVTIVTQFDKIAPLTDVTLEGPNLHRMLREKGIARRAAHWIEGFEMRNDGVRALAFDLYRDGSRRTTEPRAGTPPRTAGTEVEPIDCDSVVLCTSRRSNDALFRNSRRGAAGGRWPASRASPRPATAMPRATSPTPSSMVTASPASSNRPTRSASAPRSANVPCGRQARTESCP